MSQSDAQLAYEKANCHCPKAQMACQEASMIQWMELPQKEAELKCDFDKLANAQCELAECMIEPECNCGLGLNKGSGAADSSCSKGSDCQSGLCTATSSSGGTCAPPPPSYCCLTFANGACDQVDPGSTPSMCPPSGSPSPSPSP